VAGLLFQEAPPQQALPRPSPKGEGAPAVTKWNDG